ncbi:hypothetical protein QOZ80_3BG0261600 [Eleusine coracana subsp. coracana]|nr:hypothetical protein QOZ80_3BG0261600 [Eleusine coracana subsp. coracana]
MSMARRPSTSRRSCTATCSRDAGLLQSAGQLVLGHAHSKGGPAATAARNAREGHVGKGLISGPAADADVSVTEIQLPGRGAVVTESVDRLWGNSWPRGPRQWRRRARRLVGTALTSVTIGRAMEVVAAAAAASGDKAMDQSDAATAWRCVPRGPAAPCLDESPPRPIITPASSGTRTRSSFGTC